MKKMKIKRHTKRRKSKALSSRQLRKVRGGRAIDNLTDAQVDAALDLADEWDIPLNVAAYEIKRSG